MLVGSFSKMKTEYVSQNYVLCTRMDVHDGVPYTITKAKIPFLTVDLYKRFLEYFHEQYALFDKNVVVTKLPSLEQGQVPVLHWDINSNSLVHRNRSLFTLTFAERDANDDSYTEVSTCRGAEGLAELYP